MWASAPLKYLGQQGIDEMVYGMHQRAVQFGEALQQIDTLSLSSSDHVPLAGLTQLKYLKLENSVPGGGFTEVANLPNLFALKISSIDKKMSMLLRDLPKLKNLRVLMIKDCQQLRSLPDEVLAMPIVRWELV